MKLTALFLFVFNLQAVAQTSEWQKLENVDYTIQYPSDWEVNESGAMGTRFFILSPLTSDKDKFRENVGLVLQDVSAYDIDLDQFVEISEDQIKTLITDGKLISSDRMRLNGKEIHKLVYTGTQGQLKLKFVQYFWIQNERAYILTFTCEVQEFKDYKELGEKIMNSFVLE